MVALLDVNVLVALSWPTHEAFARVQRWFARHAASGWATCPITQAGFVRVVSNPAFSIHSVRPEEAISALAATMKHSGHHFWPADLSCEHACKSFASRIVGHQQVTDAYLLGLAVHRKGKLVTLDRGVLALGADSMRNHIEVLDA